VFRWTSRFIVLTGLTTFSVLFGCGGEDTAAPDFPRAFTSVSDSCLLGLSFDLDYNADPPSYIEQVLIRTAESSTEPLFPKRICIIDIRVSDLMGELLTEEAHFLSCPEADVGEWSLSLSLATGNWHYTATGTGYGRSIEFEMQPLFDFGEPPSQCGFSTTGTIR